jgi:hypothetical protein
MTTETAPQAGPTRQLWLVFGIWVAVSLIMVWFARTRISERMWPDPDDAMRLLQVRDLLAGQSWFDVTQYRLSPPVGGPMHWSRLVDLPIAAVILLTRPFLGQFGAETAALIAVPLLTLGAAMLLVYKITSKLTQGSAPLFAVIAAPGSLGAIKQMAILRIDHHGWQIVLGLVTILAAIDDRARRSGIIAGAAMAAWLNISIEGLPFATAVGAWFAIEWLRDPNGVERLKSYLASLLGTSLFMFVAMRAPSAWLAEPHDAVSISHLAAFAVATLSCWLAVRPQVNDVRIRFALLAACGALTGVTAFLVDPHFLQGPFASLDPIVKTLWYDDVDEGLPIWRMSGYMAAAVLAQPLVGLAGGGLAIWKGPAELRSKWLAFEFLLLAITLASVCVIREATTAATLSLPGTAFLCEFVLRRARKVSLMPVRVFATGGALCIMMPAYAAPISIQPANPKRDAAMKSGDSCVNRSEMEKLRWLPKSNLAAPLDITPMIIVNTPHTAIASGYHRNVEGIRDVILLYTRPPAEGAKIIARRHVDYMVFCPQAAETLWWARNGPNGLSAMLNAGKYPDWLEPVQVPGARALKVWRVRKDLLAAPARS